MIGIINSIFALGFNVISFMFSLMLALVIGYTMAAKGRNGFLWGIAGFFFPWLIIITIFIPAKIPKLHKAIRQHPAFAGRNPIVASIMALSAMVAKSDGHISREEIQLVRNFVQRQFGISSTQLNDYGEAFDYGKEHPQDYLYFTDLLRQYRRYNIVMAVSYLFVGLSMQDGNLAREEASILKDIVAGLGLHEFEFQNIKQHFANGSQQYGGFQGGFGGYQQSHQNTYQQAGPSRVDLTKKYAEVLGVPADAEMSVIKKAYRKLAKENHPDKMAQDGMPEAYIKYANKRISEINEAYDYLKEARMSMA